MSLRTNNPPPLPKLNPKRARFVLGKIDEILAWEQQKENERDTRFVELGRYLCEVRAGQYWRVGNLKSVHEFLERGGAAAGGEGGVPPVGWHKPTPPAPRGPAEGGGREARGLRP